MTQMQRKRVVIGATATVVVLVLLALVVLNSPTSLPKQYQIDFLAVAGAAREAAESAGTGKLTPGAVEKARTVSGGLIRDLHLVRAGEVEVEANLAPREGNRRNMRVPVTIRFVRSPDSKADGEWKCLGQPVSALPHFCSAL